MLCFRGQGRVGLWRRRRVGLVRGPGRVDLWRRRRIGLWRRSLVFFFFWWARVQSGPRALIPRENAATGRSRRHHKSASGHHPLYRLFARREETRRREGTTTTTTTTTTRGGGVVARRVRPVQRAGSPANGEQATQYHVTHQPATHLRETPTAARHRPTQPQPVSLHG